MKTKKLLSILLIAVTTTAYSQMNFDLKKGGITWTGSEIVKSHTGSLKFSSASLSLDDINTPQGVFTVDMTSLTNDDMTGVYKNKLEGHLKSDDFFSVEKYPQAVLVITKVNSQNKNSYGLGSNLPYGSYTLLFTVGKSAFFEWFYHRIPSVIRTITPSTFSEQSTIECAREFRSNHVSKFFSSA